MAFLMGWGIFWFLFWTVGFILGLIVKDEETLVASGFMSFMAIIYLIAVYTGSLFG